MSLLVESIGKEQRHNYTVTGSFRQSTLKNNRVVFDHYPEISA
jgi:hypothetical protein